MINYTFLVSYILLLFACVYVCGEVEGGGVFFTAGAVGENVSYFNLSVAWGPELEIFHLYVCLQL